MPSEPYAVSMGEEHVAQLDEVALAIHKSDFSTLAKTNPREAYDLLMKWIEVRAGSGKKGHATLEGKKVTLKDDGPEALKGVVRHILGGVDPDIEPISIEIRVYRRATLLEALTFQSMQPFVRSIELRVEPPNLAF